MSDNLNGIRREYLQTDSFRMILTDALKYRPEHLPFLPTSGEDANVQVEQWKAMSAEQRGFDKAFQMITGIKIEEFNNE
jgi:hypothetical protein